jgi:hypothetical protein
MTSNNTEKERDALLMAPVLQIIAEHPAGIKFSEIRKQLDSELGDRAIQYRLRVLTESGRIDKRGVSSGTIYFPQASIQTDADIELSAASLKLIKYLKKPISARVTCSFNAQLIDSYQANETQWFTDVEKKKLQSIAGGAEAEHQPAGTYARRIMDRLLIDLSWNSSRLEGNTYSLLDTRRLIVFNEQSGDGSDVDTQMILNHRDAIEFLIGDAEHIDFNRYTIQNLHGLLANNLLANPMSAGRLREIPVGISGCTYSPLDVPQLIENYFDLILVKAKAIENPFEQALMILAFLPYLQPFDDVNKRVSRLAANIPFIKLNLVPISFVDVPATLYRQALMGFYELNDISLLKDLFIWAYTRSAQQYAAVLQQLGKPDPFRMKYREGLLSIVREIVTTAVPRNEITQTIRSWAMLNILPVDQEKFQGVAEIELNSLHEGNFARYRIRPSEFEAWQENWTKP